MEAKPNELKGNYYLRYYKSHLQVGLRSRVTHGRLRQNAIVGQREHCLVDPLAIK